MPTLAPAQNLVRIDRLAVDARLVMQMRAGRAAEARALGSHVTKPSQRHVAAE